MAIFSASDSLQAMFPKTCTFHAASELLIGKRSSFLNSRFLDYPAKIFPKYLENLLKICYNLIRKDRNLRMIG